MNNTELQQFFKDILDIDNCFDRVIELKRKNKEYKKSQFYKQTKISIHKAFTLFKLEFFNDIVKIINSPILNTIKTCDLDKLKDIIENFLSDIDPETYSELLDTIISKFMALDIKEAQSLNELKNVIRDFNLSLMA